MSGEQYPSSQYPALGAVMHRAWMSSCNTQHQLNQLEGFERERTQSTAKSSSPVRDPVVVDNNNSFSDVD